MYTDLLTTVLIVTSTVDELYRGAYIDDLQ